MPDKSCKDCVHKNVCGPLRDAKKLVDDFERKDHHSSSRVKALEAGIKKLADNCDDHMVLDKRSVEMFTKGIEDMHSAIKWSIAMNPGIIKDASTEQKKIWLGGTYIEVLKRGLSTADRLIEIANENK